MGLSAALFSGITGLGAHGEKMSVLGNNIANVNTIGFKAARMHFEDAVSQDISTSQGVGQVGRGVRLGAVYADFSQGSFENTNESTDLAVGGEGFFIVRDANSEQDFYTRSGNFRFDKNGNLVSPQGYVLQGWEVEDSNTTSAAQTNQTESSSAAQETRIVGVPTDIQLENFQSPPKETSRVSVITNLDSGETSRSEDPNNPFFAMHQVWNGQAEDPIGDSQFAYSTTVQIYDENGSSHNMTVYYDPVDVSNAGGRKVWEYIVTVDPAEDGRLLSNGTAMNTTSAAGLLGTGTLTFNAAGELTGVSSYQLQAGEINGDLKALSNWKVPESGFSQNGYPTFVANFLGRENASFNNASQADSSKVLIEMDFGMRNQQTQWGGLNATNSNAALFSINNPSTSGGAVQNLPNFGDTERSALASTSFSSGSTTIQQSQDGYNAGFLQNISVDRDGVMTGRFSNGQVQELYVVSLANFNNLNGLRRDGGNLYLETRESGPAITNRPNTAGLGSIQSNSLEQSNVDLATEFVTMITTQRGFQANSKVITTTDTMLGELIALKR
ncbi:flagellar hook protein FlgE [Desulfohalovibrio reitneri]|uniref:flagellar hook protein FlgE n=1 Tax=Desulfohalovibrio reitneri TaxID=1307759 RepID=UPI0004A6B86D|nr:flagellar hook protein FlgE [Desulfohalovibrio reitneri]